MAVAGPLTESLAQGGLLHLRNVRAIEAIQQHCYFPLLTGDEGQEFSKQIDLETFLVFVSYKRFART